LKTLNNQKEFTYHNQGKIEDRSNMTLFNRRDRKDLAQRSQSWR
jgi:hypothetical protein